MNIHQKLIKISRYWDGTIQTGKKNFYVLTCGSSTNRVDIDILTDNDEWYYARIVYSSGSLPSGSSGFNHYFKCDQWGGLISCIENEVINKIGR